MCVDAWQVFEGRGECRRLRRHRRLALRLDRHGPRRDAGPRGLPRAALRQRLHGRRDASTSMCAISWVGKLHKLGVEVVPYARLFGVDGNTVYFQHAASGEPIIFEEVDTLVAPSAIIASRIWKTSSTSWPGEVHVIGDCVTPRTAEEAVLEGLKIAAAL